MLELSTGQEDCPVMVFVVIRSGFFPSLEVEMRSRMTNQAPDRQEILDGYHRLEELKGWS